MPDRKYKSQNRNTRDADIGSDLFSYEDGRVMVSEKDKELNPYAEASKPSASRRVARKLDRAVSNPTILGKEVPSKPAVGGPTPPSQNSIESPQFNAWMSVEAVASYFGVSKQTIWRWTKYDLNFPRPQKIGIGTTRWRRSEIEAYRETKASPGQAE